MEKGKDRDCQIYSKFEVYTIDHNLLRRLTQPIKCSQRTVQSSY